MQYIPQKVQKQIMGIFDNGGKSIDRYTVVTVHKDGCDPNYYDMLALGDDVHSAHGFSNWTYGYFKATIKNAHLGKRITWSDLPEGHQAHIIERLTR